jgi:MYXO-CTERM domain-containing protein
MYTDSPSAPGVLAHVRKLLADSSGRQISNEFNHVAEARLLPSNRLVKLRPLLLAFLVCGCLSTDDPTPPALGGLRGIGPAAQLGEDVYGVPADLTLAVAYVETRWQLPAADDADHDEHTPGVVGLGGFRPWDETDPVGRAEGLLGLDRGEIDASPEVGIVATAAVLYSLARDRSDVLPPSDDPGAWFEVLEDYSGLRGDEARASYAADVLARLREGIRDDIFSGARLTLAPRVVEFPDIVGGARGYGGAEYPGARWVPASTANYSSRSAAVDRVVIHTTQGSYAGSISWFQNPSSSVSAHFVIRSSDGEITQMVGLAQKAWHCSAWNSRAVGIEHEGFVADPDRWYTTAMYESSAQLTRWLLDRYGLPVDRTHVVGHVEVPGATHTDPGTGWDWTRYMDLVRGMPPGPAYDAEFAAHDAPAEMVSGERAVVWVEFRNTGSSTWDLTNTRLGTSAPHDRESAVYDAENWIAPNRATTPDHSTYGPGTTGRFTFMIAAPEVTETTTISETFALVQEGVTWFGPDATIDIVVHPRGGATIDVDGDGASAGADCDDNDAGRFPSATDVCEDGVDQNCDGSDLACTPEIPGDPMFPETPEDPSTRASVSGGCSAAGATSSAAAMLAPLALAGLFVWRRRR